MTAHVLIRELSNMDHVPKQARMKQLSRHESCGRAGDYQADEHEVKAAVKTLMWFLLLLRKKTKINYYPPPTSLNKTQSHITLKS